MLAWELMSNDASVCWMVNVIFIWAIMPTFWLLAALNSHTPEKSARGAAARAARAVNRKAIADNFSVFSVIASLLSPRRPRKASKAYKLSLESVLRYRVKRILRRALEPISWSGHQASWRPGRSFQGLVPGDVTQTFAEVPWTSCQGAGPGLKPGKSWKTWSRADARPRPAACA